MGSDGAALKDSGEEKSFDVQEEVARGEDRERFLGSSQLSRARKEKD